MRQSCYQLPTYYRWLLEPQREKSHQKRAADFQNGAALRGLEQHCSKERSEWDWEVRAAHSSIYLCMCGFCAGRQKECWRTDGRMDSSGEMTCVKSEEKEKYHWSQKGIPTPALNLGVHAHYKLIKSRFASFSLHLSFLSTIKKHFSPKMKLSQPNWINLKTPAWCIEENKQSFCKNNGTSLSNDLARVDLSWSSRVKRNSWGVSF